MSTKKHGLSSHSLYIIHSNIKYKCHIKNIVLCSRWQQSFLSFYEDLIPTFVEGSSLHRIDLSKGFELSNVYWKPSIRSKRVPFGIVKARLEVTMKVIESLDSIDCLKDNKEDISLILADIIQQLKQ